MKKIKLLGSKLIENINYPRIPDVCIFNNPNDVYDAKFEEGDLLDANSIKQITKNIKPQDVQEYVTSTEFELKIGEINSKINDIDNAIVDLREFDQDVANAVDAFNYMIGDIRESMLSKITDDASLYDYIYLDNTNVNDPHADTIAYRFVYLYTFGTFDYIFKGNELCILLNKILEHLQCNKSIELELSTQLPKNPSFPLSTGGVFDYINATVYPITQEITDVQISCQDLKSAFTALQTSVTTTQNELNALRTNFSGAQSDLTQALGKITQHTSDISSIQNSITQINKSAASIKTDVDNLKNNKDTFIQEFTYVLNQDEYSTASTYAQYCQSAVEKAKNNFVDITHAYLKFQNNKGSVIGYGQFFGDTSTPGILGKVSYVNAYIFDSGNGREHLDFLIR